MKQTIKAAGIFVAVVVCTHLALALIVAFESCVFACRFVARHIFVALLAALLATAVGTAMTRLGQYGSWHAALTNLPLHTLAVPGAIAMAALIGFIAGRKSVRRDPQKHGSRQSARLVAHRIDEGENHDRSRWHQGASIRRIRNGG
ncbi:hypothetical protein [Paraburkholderia caballeronis]|uniref:hypothetical protein n=1 Tax=Paraburkholderia caballeronis TaxID=416943 RepID=UPI0010653F4D|nr:hypothetical protein [Paraburkholderia caballeronis]